VLAFDRYVTEFATETRRLGEVTAALPADTPVPTCPEWTVRDLVTHVGSGHRVAAGLVEQRLSQPPPFTPTDAPQEPADWPEWLAAGAARLTAAVRDAGPECPVWTWQDDRTAGFWLRRMLHDELVHRYDAEFAAGAPGPVAPDLAADGVSDILACAARLSTPRYAARGAFTGLAGTGETLLFEATDPGLDSAWLVTRAPEGAVWRTGRGPADVRVAAPARDLLLVLNRRLDPQRADLSVTGNRELFAHWVAQSTF